MNLEDHFGIPNENPHAYIAGWETEEGGWMNTEAGDPLPTPDELEVSPTVVIAIGDGEATYIQDDNFLFLDNLPSDPSYYTVNGLSPDFNIDEAVDDLEGEYGGGK